MELHSSLSTAQSSSESVTMALVSRRTIPGPTLPSRLRGWLDDCRRVTNDWTLRKLFDDRRVMLFMASPIATPMDGVPGLLKAGARDVVLVRRDSEESDERD